MKAGSGHMSRVVLERCIYTTPGKHRCVLPVSGQNRNAVTCWVHSIAYQGLQPAEKRAMREAAGKGTAA